MTVFWLLAALMAGIVLVLIIPPMFRTPKKSVVDQAQQNIAIARQQLEILEQSHQRGEVSDENYQESRAELEQSLALDLSQLERTRKRQPANDTGELSISTVITPIIIAFAVPVGAGAVYLMVGEPTAIDGSRNTATAASGENGPQVSIEEMMVRLKDRLAQNPDDTRGWSVLARSSMQLGRYEDAVLAYARLNDLMPGNPDVLVQYADALAMNQGGTLAGRPRELLRDALGLDPYHPQALWLAGMAAERRGEYQIALNHWSTLLPRLEDQPDSRKELETMIANLIRTAESSGITLQPPTPPVDTQPASFGEAFLTIRVDISPDLAGDADPTDTVFVFARAPEGPPMPLAAARMRVSDLPFEIVLDDSSAMVPDLTLSSFETVDIVARVSRSGQPGAMSGDLEGNVDDVPTTEFAELDVLISRRIP